MTASKCAGTAFPAGRRDGAIDLISDDAQAKERTNTGDGDIQMYRLLAQEAPPSKHENKK